MTNDQSNQHFWPMCKSLINLIIQNSFSLEVLRKCWINLSINHWKCLGMKRGNREHSEINGRESLSKLIESFQIFFSSFSLSACECRKWSDCTNHRRLPPPPKTCKHVWDKWNLVNSMNCTLHYSIRMWYVQPKNNSIAILQ